MPTALRALRLLARAALAIALLSGVASAQQILVSVSPAVAPLRNGVTQGTRSILSLDVVNQRTDLALRHLEFTLPAGYTVLATSTGPWGAPYAINGRVVEFRASCSATGLAPGGGRGTFLLDVTPPSTATAADVSAAVTLTNGGDDYCTGVQTWTANNPSFTRRVLRVTGAAAPTGALAGPLASLTVTWTVTNLSSSRKRTVALENGAVAGLTPTCTPATRSLNAGASGTFACTYANVPAGSYTFAAAASQGTATAVGTTLPFRVGAARVTWTRPVAVSGRAPYGFSATVVNDSPVDVSRVQVIPPAGWSGASATSANGGLAPGSGCVAGAACFTGTLPAGGSATINFRFTTAPAIATTSAYTFAVRATPSTGSGAPAVDFPQAVTLVVPPPDVAGLTVLSNSGGQTLSWSNASRPDSPHDGVVVFRTTAPTVPPFPQDFVDYTQQPRPAEVVYADGGGSTTRDFAEPAVGTFYYRVCSRDAYLVYSSCSTGFWNGQGYADSAVSSASSWTGQLGSEATHAPTLVTGNRVAVQTQVPPAVVVLDLATGQRSFDPVVLPALPSAYSPATRLVNGRFVLFAADQSGTITAIDVDAGTVLWQSTKAGESFVAGVSGITRSYGAPAFQAAYPMDVLLLGSTTGRVLAVDAITGSTLWTVDAGGPVRALVSYDDGTNRFYVPTAGAGVAAFDLGPSSPTTPAVPLAGWTNPGGNYSIYCAKSFEPGSEVCLDRSGLLQVLDGATGAVRASHATGLTSPSTLVRVTGTSPGFVVGNASQIQRIVATGTPWALSGAGSWSSGSAVIASALVFSTGGYIMVTTSAGTLEKLQLSNAQWMAQSPAVPAVLADRRLGSAVYNSTARLFVFGTSEGRVWAVPSF